MAEFTNDTMLIYGFALFFMFLVIIVLIIRYSNKELVKKLGNVYDKLKISESEVKHLADTQMSANKELKREIHELRKEIEEIKVPKQSVSKERQVVKATA